MTPFERWSVWLSTAGTLVTGLVYWWMKEMMSPPTEWAVINHPLQPWMLKAHIIIAPFLVFAVGMITVRHIWNHYRMGVKKGRKSGLITALIIVPMILTGYLLQVFTAETLVRVLAWSHLILGIVYSVGLMAHWPATRNGTGRGAGRDTSGRDQPDEARPKGSTKAELRAARSRTPRNRAAPSRVSLTPGTSPR